MISKPKPTEVSPFFHDYLNLVKEEGLLTALERTREETNRLLLSVPAQMENYAYAENKWTIKEVVRHIIDCERIYAYRALRFSRLDNTELSGFDENAYTANLKQVETSLGSLLVEYESVRQAGIYLFKSMTEEMLDYKGIANKREVSARTLGFLTAGHNRHHCMVMKTRYFSK